MFTGRSGTEEYLWIQTNSHFDKHDDSFFKVILFHEVLRCLELTSRTASLHELHGESWTNINLEIDTAKWHGKRGTRSPTCNTITPWGNTIYGKCLIYIYCQSSQNQSPMTPRGKISHVGLSHLVGQTRSNHHGECVKKHPRHLHSCRLNKIKSVIQTLTSCLRCQSK